MELEIDIDNIEGSFDRIAKNLLLNSVLSVNGAELEITEIEFYFYHDAHRDDYTHKHLLPAGYWRFHRQGIDITLKGTKTQDGGILIRGIKHGQTYINGPVKSLAYIFSLMGPVSSINSLQLLNNKSEETEMFKVFRHLPNKEKYDDFQHRNYRYLKDFENLAVAKTLKSDIQQKMIPVL